MRVVVRLVRRVLLRRRALGITEMVMCDGLRVMRMVVVVVVLLLLLLRVVF